MGKQDGRVDRVLECMVAETPTAVTYCSIERSMVSFIVVKNHFLAADFVVLMRNFATDLL